MHSVSFYLTAIYLTFTIKTPRTCFLSKSPSCAVGGNGLMPINSDAPHLRGRGPAGYKRDKGAPGALCFGMGWSGTLLLEVALTMEIFSFLVETSTSLGSSQAEAGFPVSGRKSVCTV